MVDIGALRRSLLFVPGGELRKIERAPATGADTLLFDLEDAVPLDAKERARGLVVQALRAGRLDGPELAVRVNAIDTPHFAVDLEAIVAARCRTVVLPKCQEARDVMRASAVLDALEAGLRTAPVRIMALVESARGVLHALEIAEASPRVEALCFGHADFALNMGLADADAGRGVVLHARCQVAIAARAAGVTPVDTIHLAVRDEVAFRADVDLGRSLGYTGKLCIHPAQVAIANEAHAPTAAEIAHAREVIAGWNRARREGRGTFVVDGRMVDAPLVAAQEHVLERARRAGLLDSSGRRP